LGWIWRALKPLPHEVRQSVEVGDRGARAGADLQEAGDAARFHHTDSSEPTGTVMTDGGVLHLESGVSAEIKRELMKRGHHIEEITPVVFGGYQAIRLNADTGVYAGATESRKDGMAAGY